MPELLAAFVMPNDPAVVRLLKDASRALEARGSSGALDGYTRKSSEEEFDMELNSLDAQREACEAFIASQRAEGWVLVHDRYNDDGVSGSALERPALRRLQENALGGLRPAAKRSLARWMADSQLGVDAADRPAAAATTPPATRLKPGAVLVRTWHSVTHSVAVTDDDFDYQGQSFQSLSVIARKITGAHWSGPRFFGLTGTRRAVAAEGENAPRR